MIHTIEKIIEYISMVTLLIMVVIVFSQVLTRYIFNFTPRWSEETAVILMIWFGFISVAMGVKKGTHLSISFLVNLFPITIRKYFFILDELMILIFGYFITVNGADLSINTLASILPGTELPATVEYMPLPISGVMIMIYSILRIIDLITNKNIAFGGENP